MFCSSLPGAPCQRKGKGEWFCGPAPLPSLTAGGPNKGRSRMLLLVLSGAREVWGHFLGKHDSVQSQSGSDAFRRLILPEGQLSIVTAGGQKPPLLRVPGHAVDILGVGLRHMGCQGEGGLLRVWAGILLKYSDGIIPTGSSQGPRQLTPGGGGEQVCRWACKRLLPPNLASQV